MFQLVGYERDWVASNELNRRLKAARGSGRPTHNDLIDAAMEGDAERVEELIAILRDPNVAGNLQYPVYIATWAGDYPLADRLARRQTRPENGQLARLEGHVNVAELLVARGRWAAASRELDQAAALSPDRTRLARVVLATLPFLHVPEADLRSTFAELEQWTLSTPGPDVPPAEAYDAHLRLYFLGLLAAKLGEEREALSFADDLEALEDPASTAVPGELATTIRADVAWRRGDSPQDVIAALGPLRGHLPAVYFSRPEFAQEHARYIRAAALVAAGQHDEAVRWLDNTFVITPGWVYYPGPVAYLKARALAGLGRADEADRERATYAEYWADADAEIGLPGS